ncbi:hexokinase-4, chloroplastic-like [Papaver somniferum]|uniref:hexokinase-4, chloroplastic-like n=1 Tax=Papaver somniferum TaxID=3469 RepID=UPI000E6FD4DC|nr:hexokinase-4, chloroplastic-like [Papaver somniferum]
MGDCSKTISENSILEILQDECATPIEVLNRVADSMITHMKAGFNVDGARDLKMLLSYVNSLPTKQETGLFYALDIGGTNCRVLRVKLDGEDIDIHKISREIPALLKTGTSKIGEDVVACLVEAMKEQELDMFSVTALVNDTVGTLAGARYKDSDVKVAVIWGTGTNACYRERTDVIPKLNRQGNQGHVTGNTIINTEWGAFCEGLPLTEFDQDLGTDLGKQIFEKMISGKYLGEIVTRILLKMAESENLFGEHDTPSAVLSTRELNEMQAGRFRRPEKCWINIKRNIQGRDHPKHEKNCCRGD